MTSRAEGTRWHSNGAPLHYDADQRWDALWTTDFVGLRRVMSPEWAYADDEEIEHFVAGMFPQAHPDDVENFMRALQKVGKAVAPVLKRAAPGAIQGAVQGGMVAGPWGAVAGALGGGAMGALGGGGAARQSASPPASPVRPASPSAPTRAATSAPLVPGQRPAAVPTGVDPAAAQLLALLMRPETMQALLALLMSGAGRSSVRVGERHVPTSLFAEAVAELAAEVADGASALEDSSGYWMSDLGESRCDPFNPAERSALLLADLAQVDALRRDDLEDDLDEDAWADEDEGDHDPFYEWDDNDD